MDKGIRTQAVASTKQNVPLNVLCSGLFPKCLYSKGLATYMQIYLLKRKAITSKKKQKYYLIKQVHTNLSKVSGPYQCSYGTFRGGLHSLPPSTNIIKQLGTSSERASGKVLFETTESTSRCLAILLKGAKVVGGKR